MSDKSAVPVRATQAETSKTPKRKLNSLKEYRLTGEIRKHKRRRRQGTAARSPIQEDKEDHDADDTAPTVESKASSTPGGVEFSNVPAVEVSSSSSSSVVETKAEVNSPSQSFKTADGHTTVAVYSTERNTRSYFDPPASLFDAESLASFPPRRGHLRSLSSKHAGDDQPLLVRRQKIIWDGLASLSPKYLLNSCETPAAGTPLTINPPTNVAATIIDNITSCSSGKRHLQPLNLSF